MSHLEIPRKAVYRLSVYYRCLQRLTENKAKTVSSAALAKAAGVKPTQLRKDLAYFGQFGTRGLGYEVEALRDKLTAVLGTTHLQPVVLVGAGYLGNALLGYHGFAREGFEIVAAFDIRGDRIRSEKLKIPLYGMNRLKTYVEAHSIKMAILTVPARVAQEIANQLVACGIQAILNFAPIVLEVPGGVIVNNVDLAIELENLSYFIR